VIKKVELTNKTA